MWTYNQGVLLGALAEFSQVNANSGVLRDARLIADASLTNLTDKDGILHDSCEPKCNADGVQFKGIFMRNLRELYEIVRDPRYLAAFTRNADSIWTRDRTPENRFGEVWCGPPGTPKAGSHSSALDALIAAIPGQK